MPPSIASLHDARCDTMHPMHALMSPCMPHAQTYVLKLARSGEEGEKIFLLLESGSRFHTVQVCVVSGGCWALKPPLSPLEGPF